MFNKIWFRYLLLASVRIFYYRVIARVVCLYRLARGMALLSRKQKRIGLMKSGIIREDAANNDTQTYVVQRWFIILPPQQRVTGY